MKNRCCICLVLYKPNSNEIKKIAQYMNYVEKIYIYDNSETSSLKIITEITSKTNFQYYFNGENDGISIAYNKMAEDVVNDGFDFFLALDQDSTIAQTSFSSALKSLSSTDNVAIYAMNTILNSRLITDTNRKLTDISFAITSGSIFNIRIFIDNGGYDENLFIDGVDREYCLRALKNRQKIKLLNGINLYQQLGQGRANLLGIYEHNPLRNYYIYRNRFYVIRKYPYYFKGFKKIKFLYLSCLKQILSIILFESDKLKKLKYLYKGYSDYKLNIGGKIKLPVDLG
ncbi:hypothetical protein BCY75_04670 [Latilactobacillus curvatus]|nr:hypothetical protein BCY75_04670 [Latilactobacillus curvatus]